MPRSSPSGVVVYRVAKAIACRSNNPHNINSTTKQTIEVIVALDGAIQIDAVGFKGADCEHATKFSGRGSLVRSAKAEKA